MKVIAKAIKDVMEIEEDYLDINPFRRLRVWLDITKLLKRFQQICLKNQQTVQIPIKYERLPHFCFLCGLLSHTEKDCTNVTEEEKDVGYGWGLNIRASPLKGLSKNVEEVNALKSRKSLFVVKPKEKENIEIFGDSTGVKNVGDTCHNIGNKANNPVLVEAADCENTTVEIVHENPISV